MKSKCSRIYYFTEIIFFLFWQDISLSYAILKYGSKKNDTSPFKCGNWRQTFSRSKSVVCISRGLMKQTHNEFSASDGLYPTVTPPMTRCRQVNLPRWPKPNSIFFLFLEKILNYFRWKYKPAFCINRTYKDFFF